MDYNIYVTNALTGNEEILPSNCIIITADQIEKILKLQQVSNLNKTGGTIYGHLNVKCMDRKTGDYYLKRGNKILIEECNRIIPIAKNYNYTGIIFYETYQEEKYFLTYRLDPTDLNSIDNIQIVTTKYCIFNKVTKKITAISSYRKQDKNNVMKILSKKNLIKNYIQNHKDYFTANYIKNELIAKRIIDNKDISLLLQIINQLLKEGTIEYFVDENKEIFYKITRNNKKLTKS